MVERYGFMRGFTDFYVNNGTKIAITFTDCTSFVVMKRLKTKMSCA